MPDLVELEQMLEEIMYLLNQSGSPTSYHADMSNVIDLIGEVLDSYKELEGTLEDLRGTLNDIGWQY